MRPGYDYLTHRLWWLKLLNETDKHRLMHASYVNVTLWSISEEMEIAVPADATTGHSPEGSLNTGIETGDRAEIGRFLLPEPGPDPQMSMKGNFTLDVAFSAEGRTFRLHDLGSIWSEVSVVYRLFEPLFD
jgi:hypothetical protein